MEQSELISMASLGVFFPPQKSHSLQKAKSSSCPFPDLERLQFTPRREATLLLINEVFRGVPLQYPAQYFGNPIPAVAGPKAETAGEFLLMPSQNIADNQQ